MKFTGGINRPDSRLFRRVSTDGVAALDVDQDEVIITLGRRFSVLFESPFVWATADLEFNRQPRKISGYVGLRNRGEAEWTWFRTRYVDELSAALAAVGATEVAGPPLRMKDTLSITLFGSMVLAIIGAFLLAFALTLQWKHPSFSNPLIQNLHIFGLVALILGVIFIVIHLWGRRKFATRR